jgi:hypothetical protein
MRRSRRCSTVMLTVPACWPSEGGTPSPRHLIPKYSCERTLIRTGIRNRFESDISKVGEAGGGCSRRFSTRAQGAPPPPPAFDSKIFLRKDFDSNQDTELIRVGYIERRMGPEACAHVCCRCIVRFPTLRPEGTTGSKSGPVRRDTTLGAVWLFFNYTGGVKGIWAAGGVSVWCPGQMMLPEVTFAGSSDDCG